MFVPFPDESPSAVDATNDTARGTVGNGSAESFPLQPKPTATNSRTNLAVPSGGASASSSFTTARYGSRQPSPAPYSGSHNHDDGPQDHPSWSTYHHEHNDTKVDRNVFKRNMSIAKGFMDIGLFSANCNQLRNTIIFGDHESLFYYTTLAFLSMSIFLQVGVKW